MQSYVYAYRGGLIENRHRVSLAVVNPTGELLAHSGDPQLSAHLCLPRQWRDHAGVAGLWRRHFARSST